MSHPPRVFIGGKLLERIAPGIYSDGRGTMHIALDELLTANGYADTEANRAMMLDAAREILSRNNPPTPLQVID